MTLILHFFPGEAQQLRARLQFMIAILERVQLFGETPLLDNEIGSAQSLGLIRVGCCLVARRLIQPAGFRAVQISSSVGGLLAA